MESARKKQRTATSGSAASASKPKSASVSSKGQSKAAANANGQAVKKSKPLTTQDGAAANNKKKAQKAVKATSQPEEEVKEEKQSINHDSVSVVDADGDEPEEQKDVTFASLGLNEMLCKSCADVKWTKPSEIQRESIPLALQGRDIIGLAETGSGKTGAFGLPMLQALLENPQPFFGLVLAPTRELAVQISEQLTALGSSMGVRSVVIVGGVDMMEQAIALSKRPHIIVATPGRIVDHLEHTKGFDLRNLKYLILDEADRLLDMDFEKEIDVVLASIPRERRTMLFSATMTSKVAKLQRASLTKPVKVEVSRKYQTAKGLVQQYCFFPVKYKDCYLAYILNEMAGNSTIIFAGTCDHAQRVALMLRNLGFPAIPLHGKLSQPKRLGALNKFKSAQRNILVATDVASRGLDIPQVDVVINYDIPTHSKDYIHRVGRTARAGRSGRAITFVTQYDIELYQRIEKLIETKLDLFPTEEDAVMMLLERVAEAQRIAVMELRERDQDRKAGKKAKRAGGGDDDEEEGGAAAMLARGSKKGSGGKSHKGAGKKSRK